MNETGSASNMPRITSTSVKVMRSHDYCHFEVVLGTTSEHHLTLEEVDALRKAAARLADKAVAQYKIAKEAAETLRNAKDTLSQKYRQEWYEAAIATPESERTDGQKAVIKEWGDAQFAAGRRPYDYEDDWQEEPDDDDDQS